VTKGLRILYWFALAGLVILVSSIPSEKLRIVVISIFCILFLIEVVYKMYKDLSSGLYATTKYIALLHGISIVDFIIILYFYFIAYHQTNSEDWIDIHYNNIAVALMLLAGIELVIEFLKREKFIKPCENDLHDNKM
jgi:hypothetical protein